jgi:heme/copper-type cytochrome/quinol oxidase subunit 3
LNHALARLLYIIEFFLALLATLELWSQVGGQTHLDLMPWHLKLALSLAMAAAAVKATAAAVTTHRAWNRRTIAWLAIVVLLAIVMGMITYYYHLNEPRDEDDMPQVALLVNYFNFIQP